MSSGQWYQEDTDLPQEGYEPLRDIKIKDIELVFPKKVKDLYSWGKRMNNCIAQQAQDVVVLKRFMYIGIKYQGKFVGTCRYTPTGVRYKNKPGHVYAFYGKNNANLDQTTIIKPIVRKLGGNINDY